ncbi:Mg2+ and Co2+ transporter [Vibrio sinaloensis DSM 21326]|uniref:Mg2+ and Co2+ transporter n=1 Tax=Vibrio sinaloensis DSM 21326 TaxID=945550 RepID=E8M489_PHOS4|nr:CorA family divalent cation transporter [Vibrio sinaloensis]EGA71127.1 Mg2+ and Co2+ transporter [Vibrio sinaloensis DSM 21326]
MSDFLISRWCFSTAKPVSKPNLAESFEQGNWYHCQREQAGLREWLAVNQVPSAIIDSLLANDTRPRFETYSEDCFLVILRGINLNQGSEPDDMLSLRILWFNNTLITTRKVPSRAVSQLLSDLENGSGPRSLDSVLTSLMNSVNRLIADFLSNIEESIGELEQDESMSIKEINQTHLRLLKLRRYIKPQRYVFEDLINAQLPMLTSQSLQIKNGLDSILRINESIEFYIDQINFHLGSVNQKQNEIMNRNTYLFSIIAGIFLPASFFTGLLGVNIGGIPGVDEPMAFTLFCLSLLLIAVVEIIILKKFKFI